MFLCCWAYPDQTRIVFSAVPFICTFLLTSASHSHSNWWCDTVTILVHAAISALMPMDWTTDKCKSWEEGRWAGGPARAVGFPAARWNHILQRAWFWHKESPAELSAQSVWMSCYSRCRFFLALPLCPVIVPLFCLYSPSDQRPPKTGPAPRAPSWLRQLFDHDEQWAGVQQLHWLWWRWQHKQVGRAG